MTRRKLLFAAGASVAAAAYPVVVEPAWLELTTTSISIGGAERGALRILQLSDLHASFEVPFSRIGHAIEMGLAAQPDIVCLTGDFVTHRKEYQERRYVRVLRRLSAARPTFAVMGNHDGGAWTGRLGGPRTYSRVARLLEEAGVQLLHNRSQEVEVRGGRFALVGLADLWSKDVHPDAAFQSVPAGRPAIVLAHNPDTKDSVRRFQWDVMLSGHTHGGQVVIPFEGPPYVPVKDKRYLAGLKPWDGRQIYVSRGVGSLSHVRFMCRPEVTILDISTGRTA